MEKENHSETAEIVEDSVENVSLSTVKNVEKDRNVVHLKIVENVNHSIVMVEIVEDSEKRENVHLIETKLVTLENVMNVDFQKEMFHLANLVSIVVIKIKNPENISQDFLFA